MVLQMGTFHQCSASLVPDKQTVPRSELLALALGQEAASMSLRSDCNYVVDGSAQLIRTIETGNDPSELVNFNGINTDLSMDWLKDGNSQAWHARSGQIQSAR